MKQLCVRVTLAIAVSLAAMTAHAAADDLLRMTDQLDALDRQDLLALIDKADQCTLERDYKCAEDKLKQAGKFAHGNADRQLIAKARARIAKERQVEEREDDERIAAAKQAEREERCNDFCSQPGEYRACVMGRIGPQSCSAGNSSPNMGAAMVDGFNQAMAGAARINRIHEKGMADLAAAQADRQRREQEERERQAAQRREQAAERQAQAESRRQAQAEERRRQADALQAQAAQRQATAKKDTDRIVVASAAPTLTKVPDVARPVEPVVPESLIYEYYRDYPIYSNRTRPAGQAPDMAQYLKDVEAMIDAARRGEVNYLAPRYEVGGRGWNIGPVLLSDAQQVQFVSATTPVCDAPNEVCRATVRWKVWATNPPAGSVPGMPTAILKDTDPWKKCKGEAGVSHRVGLCR